jgi:hypothetical protein
MAKVVDNVGRRVFEGPMDQAKAFVESRYPKVHVDPQANMDNPPQPDVKVVDENGGEHTFHGADAVPPWVSPEAPAESETENA